MNAAEAFFESRDRNVFIPTAQAMAALDALDQGLSHALPMVLLTGAAGTGKSMVVREALARWTGRVHAAWLDVTAAPPSAFFPNSIRLFGGHVRAEDKRPEFVGRLAHALTAIGESGRTPLLIVEDAHLLDATGLAELGRIESAAAAADLPFKLVLVGRNELFARVSEPAMQGFAARIATSASLAEFTLEETREFLPQRFGALPDGSLVFTKKATRTIHEASRGCVGTIVVLADEALRCAHAVGVSQVSSEHVRATIAAETGTGMLPPNLAPIADAGGRDEEAQQKPAPKKSPEKPVPLNEVAPPSPPAAREGQPERRGAIPAKPKVIAAHKPPEVPPQAAAHMPPPAPRKPSLPVPPSPDLDSGHPRVRDWVSRFTDGQPPIRFGGRSGRPADEPEQMFPLDAPPPSPSQLDADAKAAAKAKAAADARAAAEAKAAVKETERAAAAKAEAEAAKRAAEAKAEAEAKAAEEREIETKAVAEAMAAAEAEAAAEAKKRDAKLREAAEIAAAEAAAEEIAAEEVRLAEEAARALVVEISPEQLTPPPIVLDVPPAPTPTTPALAPVEPAPAASEPKPVTSKPAPAASKPEPVASEPEPKPAPSAPVLTPANAQPLSRKKRRAAERKAQREARRAPEPGSSSSAPPAPKPAATAAPKSKPPVAAARPAPPAPPASAPNAEELLGPRAKSAAAAAAKAPVMPKPTPRAHSIESGERNANNSGPPVIEKVLAALIPIVLILGMAIAAIILSRRGAFDRPNDPVAAAPSATTAPVPSVEPAPAPALPAPDASNTAPVVDMEVVQEPVAQESLAQVPVAPESSVTSRFCLSVGSYLFEDKAREKARALARQTGQKAWIESVVVGDSRSYRILFGAFPTEAAAERAADRLLSNGLVTEALVENLPGSSPAR